MDVTTRYHGFTPREQAIIKGVRDRIPELLGRLTIRAGGLPEDIVGRVDEDVLGDPVITLDLDKVGLPDGALAYLVAHELSHVASGHAEIYEKIANFPAHEQRIVKDAAELAADNVVDDWGFGHHIDAWERCFPDDQQLSDAWRERAEKAFIDFHDRLEAKAAKPGRFAVHTASQSAYEVALARIAAGEGIIIR